MKTKIALVNEKKLHLEEIYKITVEQNRLLQEELNWKSIGRLEVFLAEKQRHIDKIGELEKKFNAMNDNRDNDDHDKDHYSQEAPHQNISKKLHRKIRILLNRIQELDNLNNSLALDQQKKLKTKIKQLQQNKKSQATYRSFNNLQDGAFIDIRR